MRTPRATLIGLGALAGLALVAGGAGFGAAALSALIALAAALAVVEFTFSRPVVTLCGGAGEDSADALARLKQWLPAALRKERDAADEEARWRSDVRAAISAKTAAAEACRARAALADPVATALRALAEGDLTKRIEAPELAREFEAAVALYNKTVFALASSASAIGARAREITSETQGLSERAEILGWNAAPAREALHAVAQHLDQSTRHRQGAQKAVIDLRKTTSAAREALIAGAESAERMVAARSKIDEIADSIDGFVFQLRLVAVNAGVEAARAGDKGRGGKVVAQELRTLAEKTAAATFQLTTALGVTLDEAEASAKALRESADAAEQTIAFTLALDAPAPLPPLREIETALDALSEATTRDAKSAEDIGAASRSLETLVGKLAALAGHFRYAGAEDLPQAEAAVREPSAAKVLLAAPSRAPARRLRAV